MTMRELQHLVLGELLQQLQPRLSAQCVLDGYRLESSGMINALRLFRDGTRWGTIYVNKGALTYYHYHGDIGFHRYQLADPRCVQLLEAQLVLDGFILP